MNLGTLGWDDTIRMLAESAGDAGDRIALAAIGDTTDAGVLPGGVVRCHRDRLLDSAETDAILVAANRWDEERAETVKTLVQIGRPLVVAFPPTISMLWAFEIEMIRSDAGGLILPFLPERLHPFVGRLRDEVEACLAGSSPLGSLDAITIDRPLNEHTRDAVLAAFARDADLLRVLAGEPSRLAAIGGRSDAASLAGLTVECGGADRIPTRWQATRTGVGGPTARLTLLAERGTLLLEMPSLHGLPGSGEVEWSLTGPSHRQRCGFSPARVMLERLRASLSGTPVGEVASWPDAARLIELAETVPRSLTRARSIDLHQEEFSEIGTFKGTMASLGCGLVLAALVVLVLATLVAGIAREAGWTLGERMAGGWPIAVLMSLGVFLLLQLLPLLVGASKPSDRPAVRDGRQRDDAD